MGFLLKHKMEEQENQSYQDAPQQMFQNSDKADILDKIDPTEIVTIIRNKLMGNDYIDGKWVRLEYLQTRALTPLGAWDLSNLMLAVSSKNVTISNLTDVEIKKRVLNICKQAQYMCLKNWKEYGIDGVDQLGFVHEIIFSNSLITLKQPMNEGVRKMLMSTINEQRSYVGESNERQKKSWFKMPSY